MQLPFNLLDQMIDAAAQAIDNEVSHFAVERIALCEQFLELLHRVGDLQQRAVGIEAGALEQQARRGTKVHDGTALFQGGPILGAQHGSATGSHDQIGFVREFGNDLCLAITKTLLALDVENQRNPDAGARLDLVIRIDEGTLQAPCQLPADRGFPRAGHAYQENIVLRTHERIVAVQPLGDTGSGAPPGPQKTGAGMAGPGKYNAPNLSQRQRLGDDTRRNEYQ